MDAEDPSPDISGTADRGTLTPLLDDLGELAARGPVSLGDVIDLFGTRGVIPVMLVPALIVLSPLSAIPILPTICGTMIFLVAMQMAIGRQSVWLPGWLRRRSLAGSRIVSALARIRPVAAWLDRNSGQRLAALTSAPGRKVLQVSAALCGLAMPFLELVPLSSSLLALAICLMGLAMLSRDGVWAAIALLPVAAAVTVIVTVWGGAI